MASRASVCFKPFGLLLLLLLCVPAFAQSANLRGIGVSPRARITQAIDPSHTVPLKGNVHPLARAQYDRGAAPDSLPADRMLLVLQRSPEQQAALDQLMQEQQTKSSPNYHRWLTPQEFGQTFGPAESDVNVITNWLTSQGFQVNNVAAARNVIEFSGTAAQVRQAFGTQIHEYNINGRQHFANATDPQIPEALAPVVAGVASLNSFRKKPMSHGLEPVTSTTPTGVEPQFSTTTKRYVGPADFAVIYNLNPLYGANIDGSGQEIAIVGRTNIDLAAVRAFRSMFGLAPKEPNVILNGENPGIISGEDGEAYLDVEWSGAVAPGAQIDFVITGSTFTTDGVDLSSLYIVDHDLAPVMSVSFGACEQGIGSGGRQFYYNLWQQAAAQGITVSVSSGDNGSAGCDDPNNNGVKPFVAAKNGVGVSGLASTPFNVALGGTDFDQTSATLANYWNTANDPSSLASAKSYIPESTWNESCAQSGTASQPSTNCTTANIQTYGIWAGSGGRSGWTEANGAANAWAKPAWQTGFPEDGARDIPDVSLFSASGSKGLSAYAFCVSASCSSSSFWRVGGTSAAAPAFAGIMALVNQKTGLRQGNANYSLYKLAAQSNARCNSSDPAQVGSENSCIFYDTTKGTIAVPCTGGTQADCSSSGITIDPKSTSTTAWVTGTGYDLATGLGSMNVSNLVNKWSTATFTPTTTTITNLSPATSTHGSSVSVSVTVAAGSGTPTGNVTLVANYPDGSSVAFDKLTLPAISKTTSALPGGQYKVIAHYSGNGTFGASDSAPVDVTVNAEQSKALVALLGFDSNNNPTIPLTNTPYGSDYILRMWVTDSAGSITNSATWCENINVATCPTGTLTLTDGVAPLDGGIFKLVGLSYVDDPIIQLSPGTHPISVSYPGDSSYLASSGSTTVTITKATTSIAAPTNPGSVKTNNNVSISATVTGPNSNGAAPGASNGANAAGVGVTFYDGSTPMPGSVIYLGTDASATSHPTLKATITTQFTTTGTHQITAQYNGDVNYSASAKSSATAITVTQGAGPATHLSVTAPANASTGTAFNFTVTALDANNVTATGYTGTVHFTSTDAAATLPTNATLTNGTGSFSAILNTIGTFTLTATDTVTSSIAGTSGNISVGAPVADFTISAAPVTAFVSKGSSGTSTITVTSTNGFASTVTLTCSVAPLVSKGPTCSVNPASVTPAANATATSTLTVATTANTTASLHKGFGWTLAGGSGVFAFVLLGIPGLRRRGAPSFAKRRVGLLLLLIGLMAVGGTVACGGGGGTTSGGGSITTPGTPSGTYNVTVTGTSGTLTHPTVYTITVP